jgi:hypothetical protein
MSSVITISQPPTIPGDKSRVDTPTAMSFGSEDDTQDTASDTASDSSSPVEIENPPRSGSEASESEPEVPESNNMRNERKIARGACLAKLQGSGGGAKQDSKSKCKAIDTHRPSRQGSQNTHATVRRHRRTHDQDAVIVLKEEKANILHDFLKFVYPQYVPTMQIPYLLTELPLPHSLQCNISWNNVEGLMNISHKLCVPALQRECLTFLLTHAAGKPIKAMRIAELFEEEELYRESSRFVLDNPGGWSEEELSTLSQETLLKLEKR